MHGVAAFVAFYCEVGNFWVAGCGCTWFMENGPYFVYAFPVGLFLDMPHDSCLWSKL